jgi:hypothetical protein
MGRGGCQVEEQGWFRHPATAMRGGGWRRSSDARVGEDGEGGVRLGGAHLEERERGTWAGEGKGEAGWS